MRALGIALLTALAFTVASLAVQPPAAKPPDAATRARIDELMRELRAAIAKVGKMRWSHNFFGDRPPLEDVEVHLKAAEWIVRHNEFYHPEAGAWTVKVLEQGLERARQMAQRTRPWLRTRGTSVVHGYRSSIDDSLQPYAVTYPADFDKDPEKPWRVDVVLHGRDPSLTEVKFIHQHSSGKPAPKDQPFIRIDVYGRGNNGYRWAGEEDVLDAFRDFWWRNVGRIDIQRVVLRGFSMGGAGTWHLGLHRPVSLFPWCVIGPGAGFTTTRGYLKNLPDPLPAHVEKCLHIYDAVDYAENAAMVPVVAYAGGQDPQIAAGRAVEKRLKELGIPMTFLVAPGVGHQMPPEWQKKAEEEYAKYAGAGKGRPEILPRVRFVTYTLKYPHFGWGEIVGLDRHYEQARVEGSVEADRLSLNTTNVRGLSLNAITFSGMKAPGRLIPDFEKMKQVIIDGQRLPIPGGQGDELVLEKREGRWTITPPAEFEAALRKAPRKTPGLTGPIDDAFTKDFLCVRGTGQPWHPAVGRYADADLKRFTAEWDKYLRGTLPIKDDTAVRGFEVSWSNLILFGDPSSNRLIARVLEKLPLTWTRDKLEFAGRSYDPARHVPVLIFPNPLNPQKYVVINSGHTFHAQDFQGSNALLYPRLGDWAVLALPPPDAADPLAATVDAAGLFDDDWRLNLK